MSLLAEPADLESLGEEDIEDPRAQDRLAAASALVRSYCRWSITKTSETFTLDGEGTALLFLPTARLTEVTAIRLSGSPVEGWSWSENGVVERDGGWWPVGRRNVALDIVHGFDLPPADLREVTAAVALRAYLNPAGATSEAFAGSTTSWPSGFGLTVLERSVLDRYALAGRA